MNLLDPPSDREVALAKKYRSSPLPSDIASVLATRNLLLPPRSMRVASAYRYGLPPLSFRYIWVVLANTTTGSLPMISSVVLPKNMEVLPAEKLTVSLSA